MRKVLIVFAALAMVLGFSMSAAADDPCLDCNKCDLLNIPCPTLSGQDYYSCTYFDWERGDGSCQYPSGLGLEKRNCAALFYVCDCPGFQSMTEEDNTVGVRISIVQGDGVYFPNDPEPDITVQAFATNANNEACFRKGTSTSLTFSHPYKYFLDSSCTKETTYKGYCDNGKVGYNPSTTPTDPNFAKGKIKGILTEQEITPDKITAATPYWIVDIPPVTVDRDEYTPGQTVKVRVDLIGDTDAGYCITCNILCTCIYDIGIMCCDASTQNCIYFPYVKVNDPWACGLVIVNTNTGSVPAAGMSLTMELMDSAGAMFTASYAEGTLTSPWWIRVLNAATMTELGWTPAPGAALLRVYSNAEIDGYTFLTNGAFGGSTLPRACDWLKMESENGSIE